MMAILVKSICFRTSRFNSTIPREYFINPNCYGDDLAKWLKVKLEKSGIKIDGPDQEDWGWYLCAKDEQGLEVIINIGRNEPNEWTIFNSFSRGLRSWFTGKHGELGKFAWRVRELTEGILRGEGDISLIDDETTGELYR